MIDFASMFEFLRKIVKSFQIYYRYFNDALIEMYFYYISPLPIIILMKKWSLANRDLRVLWATSAPEENLSHQK